MRKHIWENRLKILFSQNLDLESLAVLGRQVLLEI